MASIEGGGDGGHKKGPGVKKAKKLDFEPKSASMCKKNRIKTIDCP